MAHPLIDVHAPYLGERVILTKVNWLTHVTKRHREFNGPLGVSDVQRVVTDPVQITDDGEGRPKRKVAYYGLAPAGPYGRFLIKVPIRIGRWRAVIMTAHLIASVPPKEVVLWSKP